jgi:alanine dehydrogenase
MKTMLYLTDQEIEGLLDMTAAIDVLDKAFRAKARGEIVNRPRVRVPLRNGTYNVLAAGWTTGGMVGHKSYLARPGGVPRPFHIQLFDADAGGAIALLEAWTLSNLRTGAASGLSARHMASPGGEIAMIGGGLQARTQLEAAVLGTGASAARVYSPSVERRTGFADEMSERLGIPVRPADSARSCVDGASTVVTITTSVEPVLMREWLAPGVHVIAAGSNNWMKSEVDVGAMDRFDVIAVDDLEQARIESGELMRAAEVGLITWDQVVSLSDIVAGRRVGRPGPEAMTLFESQGIGLEDIAVAAAVYRLAVESGVGTQIPTSQTPSAG